MRDADLTTLALGTDLTGLGLHLNSPENVYKTFASPWADHPLRPEPEFKVCLLLHSLAALHHLAALGLSVRKAYQMCSVT